jgi:hypothetical protein
MLMTRKERHVVPNPQGGWDVKKPHAERVSMQDICRNHGAECVVHGSDGKIQNSNSYGKDPCPPKDNKERHVIPDSKGGWIVTRRGYVVPLDKGKEGIHKKFDEILSTSTNYK